MAEEFCNKLCNSISTDENTKKKCIDDCQKTLAMQTMNLIENIFKSDILNFALILGKPLFDLADSISDLKLAQIYSKYENMNPIEKIKIHLREITSLIHDPDAKVNNDIINAIMRMGRTSLYYIFIWIYALSRTFDKKFY